VTLEGDIRIKDRLIWEADNPHAREECIVRDMMVNTDDETWLLTIGPSGKHWNDLSRLREACSRHPHPLPEFYLGA
jgi:hypothetical protein